MDMWWIVGLTLGYLAFMGWIIWIIAYYRIKKSNERSEERLRLLEQLGSSQELTKFLNSEGGDKLLAAFGPKASDPRAKILGGFATGLVMLFTGLGFLILAWVPVFGEPDIWIIPGVLAVLAGTAVLISVAVATRFLKTDDPPDR